MKISAAGIYPDIDIDTYHSQCADGPSLSSSGLRLIASECPAKFWATSDLNPNRFPKEETTALNIGKAVHSLVLGEPEFARQFYICPHDRLNANPGKQWNDEWKAEVAAGREKRTLIRAADFEMIRDMAKAQRASPQVCNAFVNGKPEQSIFHRDAETGIWLKSRPDWSPDDIASNFIVEFKSSLSIEPRWLSSEVFKRGYEVQAAIMIDTLEAVTGAKALGLAHVCQEKEPPYLAELRMFGPDHIEYGRREYRRALKLFARCYELHLAGRPEREAWPGYTVNAEYFASPYWLTKKMENPDEFDRYADAARAANASEFYAPL